MNKIFLMLSFFMGVVVLASNYLVQFPIKYYGLEKILTYGALSYPIAYTTLNDTDRKSVYIDDGDTIIVNMEESIESDRYRKYLLGW